MPRFPKNHTIICGLEREGVEGERMFICETPEHMQTFYHEHIADHTAHIKWYHTDALLPEGASGKGLNQNAADFRYGPVS